MGAFILVILITMGSGEDLKSFEIRMNKDSQSECLKDAEKYQFPLPIISIETRCEPVMGIKPEFKRLGFQPKMNELKVLLSKLGQSEQIKGYLNKMNDSLDLIKRCFVISSLLDRFDSIPDRMVVNTPLTPF